MNDSTLMSYKLKYKLLAKIKKKNILIKDILHFLCQLINFNNALLDKEIMSLMRKNVKYEIET